MKFDAEDPAEVSKNDKQGDVDRSQGAARAISVSGINRDLNNTINGDV